MDTNQELEKLQRAIAAGRITRQGILKAAVGAATGAVVSLTAPIGEVLDTAAKKGNKRAKRRGGGKSKNRSNKESQENNGGGSDKKCACHKGRKVLCPDDDGTFNGHVGHGDCVCPGQEGIPADARICASCAELKNNASCVDTQCTLSETCDEDDDCCSGSVCCSGTCVEGEKCPDVVCEGGCDKNSDCAGGNDCVCRYGVSAQTETTPSGTCGQCVADGGEAIQASECCGNDYCPDTGKCEACQVTCEGACANQETCAAFGNDCVCLGLGQVSAQTTNPEGTCGQCIANGNPASSADECCSGNYCEATQTCGECETTCQEVGAGCGNGTGQCCKGSTCCKGKCVAGNSCEEPCIPNGQPRGDGVCCGKFCAKTGKCGKCRRRRPNPDVCKHDFAEGRACKKACECRTGKCQDGHCCHDRGDGTQHCNSDNGCCGDLVCQRHSSSNPQEVCKNRNQARVDAQAMGITPVD